MVILLKEATTLPLYLENAEGKQAFPICVRQIKRSLFGIALIPFARCVIVVQCSTELKLFVNSTRILYIARQNSSCA